MVSELPFKRRTDQVALVQTEQVHLAIEQTRRVPLPHFFVDLCVAWTGFQAGVGMFAWVWLGVMTAAQVGRTIYIVGLGRRRSLSPPQMLTRLVISLTLLGAIHAVFMVQVFMQPLSTQHYILTMILVGNAAGAVSPAAGHLPSYLCWETVFGGTLAACWLVQGTQDGLVIAALIVFLFYLLTHYVRDQSGSLIKLVSLTESLRQERDRAERASESKTRFLAAASHDLRQPLTALSYGAATVVALAQHSDNEKLARVGENISRALAESRGLLDSLLEISELDAGVVKVDWKNVDVITLLRDVSEDCLPVAREKGLRLHHSIHENKVLIAHTDAALLRRILNNLVGNAIKFTPSGTVTLEAKISGDDSSAHIHLCVSDTGVGIPVDAQARIFEEFYQVGNIERNRSRGLGLGLAIVYRLANLLDGKIEVDSAPGRGSTFTVILPMGEKPWAIPVVPPHEWRSHAGSFAGTSRVLVIDDERDVCESLTILLTTLGWDAKAVSSQEDALWVFESGFVPDAVIADYRLREGASGLEAIAALRARGCKAPAWLITGDTSPERIVTARAAGIPVIYKPVDGLHLAELLNGCLRRQTVAAR